jgi:flagellin-like hook-associated protein FlgL
MNVNLNTQYAALRSSANDLERLSRARVSSVTQLATGSQLPDSTSIDSQSSSIAVLRNTGLRLRAVESGIVNAISYLEMQASVVQNMTRLTSRMSELTSRMVDPSKSPDDRKNYLVEFVALRKEFSMYRTAQFNGRNLFNYLDGDPNGVASGDGTDPEELVVAVDENGNSSVKVTQGEFRDQEVAPYGLYTYFLGRITTATSPYADEFDVAEDGTIIPLALEDPTDPEMAWGQEGFQVVLEDLASRLALNQSEQNQLRLNLDKLRERMLVTESALSRVADVDVAAELTTLAKSDMQLRGAVATKTQSNVFADSALKLLSNQDFGTPLIQEARLSPAWAASLTT